MSSEAIHETILRDAIDLMDDVKNVDVDELTNSPRRRTSFKSIAKASDEMTLVFPVIFPADLSVKTAMMVSKAIERKAVTMLQMLFSAFYFTDATNGLEYLRTFHSNLDLGPEISFDNLMDFATSIDQFEEAGIIKITDRELYDKARRDLQNINFYLPTNISESGLYSWKVFSAHGKLNFLNEAKYAGPKQHRSKYENNYNFASGSMPLHGKNQTLNNWHDAENMATNMRISNDNRTTNYADGSTHVERDQYNNNGGNMGSFNNWKVTNNTTNKVESKEKRAADHASMLKFRGDFLNKQIMTTDIKKANELVPTMMIVNFYAGAGEGDPIKVDSMVIGVKAKLYAVGPQDIIDHIITKNKDSRKFFNFIRATTRETSFWKDFMFAIDKAKIDALSTSRKGSASKMWKVLERRAKKSKVRRLLGSTNTAIAITTMTISQNEVEYLRKYENIDVEDARIMRPIMEAYNLMGVCIVDEAVETVKFLFDTGDDVYETLSFDGLEKESDNDGYKKVVNLLSKVAR